MKVSKFLAIQAKNPWIWSHVGPPILGSEPEKKRLEWVRQHLMFVAYRPFESLSLAARNESSSVPIRNTSFCNRNMVMWQSTQYSVYCHIEGEEKNSRLAYVTMLPSKGHNTVGEVIRYFTQWHHLYWAKQGKRLIFDCVVKTTESGSELAGMTSQSIEIFEFPKEVAMRLG